MWSDVNNPNSIQEFTQYLPATKVGNLKGLIQLFLAQKFKKAKQNANRTNALCVQLKVLLPILAAGINEQQAEVITSWLATMDEIERRVSSENRNIKKDDVKIFLEAIHAHLQTLEKQLIGNTNPTSAGVNDSVARQELEHKIENESKREDEDSLRQNTLLAETVTLLSTNQQLTAELLNKLMAATNDSSEFDQLISYGNFVKYCKNNQIHFPTDRLVLEPSCQLHASQLAWILIFLKYHQDEQISQLLLEKLDDLSKRYFVNGSYDAVVFSRLINVYCHVIAYGERSSKNFIENCIRQFLEQPNDLQALPGDMAVLINIAVYCDMVCKSPSASDYFAAIIKEMISKYPLAMRQLLDNMSNELTVLQKSLEEYQYKSRGLNLALVTFGEITANQTVQSNIGVKQFSFKNISSVLKTCVTERLNALEQATDAMQNTTVAPLHYEIVGLLSWLHEQWSNHSANELNSQLASTSILNLTKLLKGVLNNLDNHSTETQFPSKQYYWIALQLMPLVLEKIESPQSALTEDDIIALKILYCASIKYNNIEMTEYDERAFIKRKLNEFFTKLTITPCIQMHKGVLEQSQLNSEDESLLIPDKVLSLIQMKVKQISDTNLQQLFALVDTTTKSTMNEFEEKQKEQASTSLSATTIITQWFQEVLPSYCVAIKNPQCVLAIFGKLPFEFEERLQILQHCIRALSTADARRNVNNVLALFKGLITAVFTTFTGDDLEDWMIKIICELALSRLSNSIERQGFTHDVNFQKTSGDRVAWSTQTTLSNVSANNFRRVLASEMQQLGIELQMCIDSDVNDSFRLSIVGIKVCERLCGAAVLQQFEPPAQDRPVSPQAVVLKQKPQENVAKKNTDKKRQHAQQSQHTQTNTVTQPITAPKRKHARVNSKKASSGKAKVKAHPSKKKPAGVAAKQGVVIRDKSLPKGTTRRVRDEIAPWPVMSKRVVTHARPNHVASSSGSINAITPVAINTDDPELFAAAIDFQMQGMSSTQNTSPAGEEAVSERKSPHSDKAGEMSDTSSETSDDEMGEEFEGDYAADEMGEESEGDIAADEVGEEFDGDNALAAVDGHAPKENNYGGMGAPPPSVQSEGKSDAAMLLAAELRWSMWGQQHRHHPDPEQHRHHPDPEQRPHHHHHHPHHHHDVSNVHNRPKPGGGG